MFNFEKIQGAALVAVAALILTSVSVGAAVGPARAVEAAPLAFAEAHVANHANV